MANSKDVTSDTEQSGSGITTRTIMVDLQDTSAKHFDTLLAQLPRKQRQLAGDAFRDGMRTMLRHLADMQVIVVLDI